MDTPTLELPLAGRALESTLIEYSAILNFAGGYFLRLEGRFTLTTAAGEFRLDPERYLEQDEDFDRVRRLVGVAVTAAVYDQSGNLEVRFADGTVIRCGPDDYEAWTYGAPDGEQVWCCPFGGVSGVDAFPENGEEERAAIAAAGAALLAEAAKYRHAAEQPETTPCPEDREKS